MDAHRRGIRMDQYEDHPIRYLFLLIYTHRIDKKVIWYGFVEKKIGAKGGFISNSMYGKTIGSYGTSFLEGY